MSFAKHDFKQETEYLPHLQAYFNLCQVAENVNRTQELQDAFDNDIVNLEYSDFRQLFYANILTASVNYLYNEDVDFKLVEPIYKMAHRLVCGDKSTPQTQRELLEAFLNGAEEPEMNYDLSDFLSRNQDFLGESYMELGEAYTDFLDEMEELAAGYRSTAEHDHQTSTLTLQTVSVKIDNETVTGIALKGADNNMDIYLPEPFQNLITQSPK